MSLRYESAIRDRFDVISSSGEEFLCRCPFHNDTGKPNLYANARRGVYLCHACGAKGHMNGVGKAMQTTTSDLRERLKVIREPKEDPGGKVRPESWLKRFDFPHEYWNDVRGFSQDTIDAFQLGYDPTVDRLTIPMRNLRGQLLGVTQRVLTNEKPKYLYPKGFNISKHLFGAWRVRNRSKVAVVEGSLDAVACWDARVPAVAMMGSRLSDAQQQVLARTGVQSIVIMTDNDDAGHNAVFQIREKLTGTGILVRVMRYRPYWTAKDPGELTNQQLRKAYHSAEPWHQWTPDW